MKCTGNDHPIWYPWDWNEKRQRWERECAMMGCAAWQFVLKAEPIGRRILKIPGKVHEHAWRVWSSVDEHHVENNMFYNRGCPCGALEFVEDIVVSGPLEFFSRVN